MMDWKSLLKKIRMILKPSLKHETKNQCLLKSIYRMNIVINSYARAFVFGLVLLASTMVPGQEVLGNNDENNN